MEFGPVFLVALVLNLIGMFQKRNRAIPFLLKIIISLICAVVYVPIAMAIANSVADDLEELLFCAIAWFIETYIVSWLCGVIIGRLFWRD